MGQARKRKFDCILVWRFDRFSRSLLNLVQTLDELRALGIDFCSYQEGIDTSTPQGKLVFGIVGSLAEFERSIIVDRVKAGLRRASAQGKHIGRPRSVQLDPIEVARLRKTQSFREVARSLKASLGAVQRAVAYRKGEKSSVGANA
jgi:DNA invertase Pin-like site-specific DNA recombinase